MPHSWFRLQRRDISSHKQSDVCSSGMWLKETYTVSLDCSPLHMLHTIYQMSLFAVTTTHLMFFGGFFFSYGCPEFNSETDLTLWYFYCAYIGLFHACESINALVCVGKRVFVHPYRIPCYISHLGQRHGDYIPDWHMLEFTSIGLLLHWLKTWLLISRQLYQGSNGQTIRLTDKDKGIKWRDTDRDARKMG